MREERIIVRPFEAFRIMEYHGIQQVNEHARVEIKGQIPFDCIPEYKQLAMKQIWVQVLTISQSTESILFYGILKEMQLEVKNGTCMMILHLCSGTWLMDCTEKIRSFQSSELSYGELLDTCNNGYDYAARIMTVAKGQTIGRMIMQYQESDWNFIKRLASMNHTVVVADCSTMGEKYFFGLPNRKEMMTIGFDEYRTQCDMEEYWYKKNHGLRVSPQDTVSYVWESRDVYKLGEGGNIDGRKIYVWKIESVTKGNELYHTYYLKAREGFQVPVTYNNNLIGVSMLGKVTKIQEEKVQMELFDDENKQAAGKCWFTYATVYSSPDGTGWYCMPEKGDQVRLYFPSNKESEAYVASSYHEESADLRTQPECKFWRNKKGKEIRLNPDSILITNNDGTYIELSDDEGIVIESTGSISIRAKNTLSVTSENASIELTAPEKIRLKQGDTEMDLGGDLRMKGTKVIL